MERYCRVMTRQQSRLSSIALAFICMLFSAFAVAKEANILKNIEVHTSAQSRTQVILEFSGPAVDPRRFTVEEPAQIVFDFPNVKNKLSKEFIHQAIGGSLVKSVNIVETDNKMRLIMGLQGVVPFDTEVNGNIIKINLEHNTAKQGKKSACYSTGRGSYQVNSFDFRRGDHGEARLVVNLSTAQAAVDFKEENGKIIASFLGASIPPRLIKQYDVMDFGTPIQEFNVSREGNDVEFTIQAAGDYDKIAYQMDKQFIIEVRSLSKAERAEHTALTGEYVGERISLNFQDVEIRAVLQIIADFSGFNMITSDSVKGNITLRLQNVPWDQAMDIILKSKALDKRQFGNVMMVGTVEEINAREKAEIDANKLAQDFGQLKSELVQVSYANAADLSVILKDPKNSLLTSRGNVTVDKRTNTLLIQDLSSKIEEVKMLIKKLDVPVRQVEISMQIVKADNTFGKALGMRFGGGANAGFGHRRVGIGAGAERARSIADYVNPAGQPAMPPSAAAIAQGSLYAPPAVTKPTVANSEGLFSDLGLDGVPNIAAAGSTARAAFALARLPNGTLLDLELQALEYENKSKTISKPKLVTLDQNKATIEQGIEIPYLQSTSSGAASIAFQTAALKMDVTPHITPDDRITLDLDISQDTKGETVDLGAAGGSPPAINTNRLTTKVLIDNGETVVLGGVLKIDDIRTSKKVPFFGDLPILGALFRNKSNSYIPSELLVFLTPRILKPLVEKE